MSSLKNKFVSAAGRMLASVIHQDRVQQALELSFDRYLASDKAQARVDAIMSNHLESPVTRGRIDGILDGYLRRDMSKAVVSRALEENPDLQKALWKAVNVRPSSTDMHWSVIPNSIRERRMVEATIEASAFVHENIPHLEGTRSPYDTLKFALDSVSVDGLYLEFGVFSGTTISFIADSVGKSRTVHGFDSFEGLPERWGAVAPGRFHTQGVVPQVPDNVELHKGWFDDTLAPFLEEHPGPAAFIHADADLYSSTNTILTELNERIVPGTIIVFDEYFNLPYWREHEYRAFMEFIERTGRNFEYIAYTDRGYSVAVKIL